MAKAKKVSKKSPKKVRTKAEKAARNLRRKEKRLARKAAAKLKASIDGPSNATSTATAPSIFPWKEKTTSDGLPYSQSIDNPDSLLSQLKVESERKVEATKHKARKPEFAGWAPQAVLHSTIEA